ncbi:hypothetical protein M422DRAFT_273135 [Sphaerobolus stellatus SS14]|uniref:Uncharacterized protein n=1 Tax=Sphaerobolus stellatus (strain SS14) TaxID=990650 RepID=A0A0C9UKC9_SPHS4|nr:hypothetical protein M422DRAFT_273135 [Sphaerobolus stellatus SS14]
MPVSLLQWVALQSASKELEEAGLFDEHMVNSNPNLLQLKEIFSSVAAPSHPLLSLLKYTSPQLEYFSSEEILSGMNKCTRQGYVQARVYHPLNAVVEYPQSGSVDGEAVAHIFRIDPSRDLEGFDPKKNIQFSLGANALQASTGAKNCSFSNDIHFEKSQFPTESLTDASREVFMKTLGFFCALQEGGCLFSSENSDAYEDSDPTAASQLYEILRDNRAGEKDPDQCNGRLLFHRDSYYRPFIQCEHRKKGHHDHLLLRNLQELDHSYLEALFNDDISTILKYEEAARDLGYGPLAPCHTVCSPREQKLLCPNWHRGSDGILKRGEILPAIDCPTRYEIYYPKPSKTPALVRGILEELLVTLGWILADATPRRLNLDSGFISGLRRILEWNSTREPTLSDLHPSLANYDHARRIIMECRKTLYPHGTGLEGVKQLYTEHSQGPPELAYVRAVESHEISREGSCTIVLCMLPAMSRLLMATRQISIDTSFKRVHKWQEFEIEAWFPSYNRSIVVSRAFITSQSATAHFLLFKRIFQVAEADTGKPFRIRHIHGDGLDSVTADGHRGQAVGFGRFCQELSKGMMGYCAYEQTKALHKLSAYDHLKRIYRYCFSHYIRHVGELKGHVDGEVLTAMMSLASADALPAHVYEKILFIIGNSGKKGIDWLKDKEAGEGWPMAAIYWGKSFMPLSVWKAAPSTSNGNEQAHRNINRDGIKLSILAGAMIGYNLDSRTMSMLEVGELLGIDANDQAATHFR